MTGDNGKKSVEEMDCLGAIRHLYEYLDGELGEQSSASFEHHLGHCRSCYSRLGFESALNEQLRKHGKKKTPETLRKRLRELIDKF